MWTCLLLFCVQFIMVVTAGTQCPTNCNCTWKYAPTELTVDCQGRPDIDPQQLSDQLDSLLSSYTTYDRLQQLIIVNSSLRHVPRFVCRLTTLKWLHISHNRLAILPDNCFTNLSYLRWFIASDNAIVTLQDGVFDGLRNLSNLDVSRNRISSIGSFSRLTTLESLYIDHNRLTRLPDNCFTNLSNLIILTASDNAIVTLQDRVFDGLTNLKMLDLSRNRISSIASVCRLTALEWLFIGHNRLTRLPDCFTNLSNLIDLIAFDNAIATLQDGVFDGLTNLKTLYLSRNRISSIASVCRLTALKRLFIDHNRLTRLPDCFTNLSNLTRLTAFDNAIVTLQDGVFDGMRNLCRLDLSRNRISSIGLSVIAASSNLSKQHGLCYTGSSFAIDLSYNKLQYIEDILNVWQLSVEDASRYCDVFLQLNISHNNIACDCINYNFYSMDPFNTRPFLNVTGADCNVTDPITKKSRIMKANNVDLSLFVCELTERCPTGCVCFRRPANATLHVYCSNKNLTVLPLELPELPDSRAKYKLDFSNNQLLRRLEHRDYFVNTSIMDVSNSSVDDVSDWEGIAKIPDVNLFGNKITSLPRSFFSIIVTTRKLNLASNQWDCSCDNRWLSGCFSSIEDRLTHKVRCYSPPRLRGKNIIQISDVEFCVDHASEAASKATWRTLAISMSSVASVIVVLLSVIVVVVIIIIYRLRVKLYTRWNVHPFDRDECLGEEMDYDVYFCCSSMDHDPHGLRIVQLLETEGYRVCYHERDFLPGQLITDNISRAIEHSKRTICLLSGNFLGR